MSRKRRLKNLLRLKILVVLALIIDGTLTYEVFDFRNGVGSGWFYLLLGLILLAIILLADSTKKSGE